MKKLMIVCLGLMCLCGCSTRVMECGDKEEFAQPETRIVMVNNVLYYDTGYINDTNGRCGTMDGEILSVTKENPTENNQSNFGKGYGYQYGMYPNTIEVYMDGKWVIFSSNSEGFLPD